MLEQANLKKFIDHVSSPKLMAIQRIQNVLLKELQDYAYKQGFMQLMPLLMSPITDPLNHDVYPANIEYEGRALKLTASMIFHKQLALISEATNKILIVAPNIRLELASKKSSSNHLLEFSQFDIEIKDAKIDDIMNFIEGLLVHVFSAIRTQCADELTLLRRKLPQLTSPFKCYSTTHLQHNEVDGFCDDLSKTEPQPFFVTNFKREFYDKEDPKNPGTYLNFDLIYPEGFGEGCSGAEREYEYEDIVRRMQELDMDLAPYKDYLSLAKAGKIPATAGCGIGIQRLLKFIAGQENISDVCLFNRSIETDFTF